MRTLPDIIPPKTLSRLDGTDVSYHYYDGMPMTFDGIMEYSELASSTDNCYGRVRLFIAIREYVSTLRLCSKGLLKQESFNFLSLLEVITARSHMRSLKAMMPDFGWIVVECCETAGLILTKERYPALYKHRNKSEERWDKKG